MAAFRTKSILKIRFQNVLFIETEDVFDGFLGGIYHAVQVEVVRTDGVFFGQHFLFNPFKQAAPIINTHKNDWETGNFTGLYQSNSFEGFVHGAKTSRKDNKSLRVFHKHYFSDEEVIKLQQLITVDIFVMKLFEGQLNIQSYRLTAGFISAFVSCLHYPGTATRNDTITAFG